MKPTKKKPALWVSLAKRGRARIPNGGLKQAKVKRRIRPITPALAKQRRFLAKASKAFLAKHPFCAVFPGEQSTSTHHSRGRFKTLLLNEKFFVPTSLRGHTWIDANRNEARKMKWNGIPVLAAKGDWGNEN